MSTINRTKFNALVDDDGSGLTGTVWNKAQIKDVILDPGDLAWGRGWTLLQSKAASTQNSAYHGLDGIPISGLTEHDAIELTFQGQTVSVGTTIQFFKGDIAIISLALAVNTAFMGRLRYRQGAMQPTLAAVTCEGLSSPGGRVDHFGWVGTNEAFTAPWSLGITCVGVPAGGTLYYAFAAHRIHGA